MTQLDANNGQISFDGTTVSIAREGAIAAMSKQQPIDIPVSDISDVVIHTPSILQGFIHFVGPGESPVTSANAAVENQRAVLLSRKHMEGAEALRAEVLAAKG